MHSGLGNFGTTPGCASVFFGPHPDATLNHKSAKTSVMAAVDGIRIGGDDGPVRKRIKISELPISSAKRSSVEGLLHVFKKKGEFDSIRKKVYSQFESGESKTNILQALQKFTDDEIEKDPIKYLGKDRRLAAPLLEGAAARADIYPTTEVEINEFIAGYLEHAETALRDARRKEIGEDAAREEQKRGAKSDEAYAAEAEVRRQERAKKHAEELRIKKKKEQELAKKRQLEALQARAAELAKETERLQREQKRRAEREAARAKQKQMEEERRKQFAEERERREKEQAEAAKREEEEREKRRKEREAAEAKRLEEEALDRLLREGGKMAEKAGGRGDFDRSLDLPLKGLVARSQGRQHLNVFGVALEQEVHQEGSTMIVLRERAALVENHTAWIEGRANRIAIEVAAHHAGDATTLDPHHAAVAGHEHHLDGHTATGTTRHLDAGPGRGREAHQILIDTYLVAVEEEAVGETTAGMIDVTTGATTAAIVTKIAIGIGTGAETGGIETETETATETGTTTVIEGDPETRRTADVAVETGLDPAVGDCPASERPDVILRALCMARWPRTHAILLRLL
ncbi:Hypothetical protein D9617_14g077370 [Elsinoe fawcettii]|nr:Hypothetical protein D9617_14g077370 [Elsinoe fawcettii]